MVPTNARVFYEKDIIIGDYLFPKNVSWGRSGGGPRCAPRGINPLLAPQTLFVLAHYAMSHDETYFPEPERFLPQRWLRGYGSPHHPFSSIPFGYGVRACVGRRIAELEMHLALARVSKAPPGRAGCFGGVGLEAPPLSFFPPPQIIQAFEVRPDPRGVEVTSVSRIVLVADKPINLEFIARPGAP